SSPCAVPKSVGDRGEPTSSSIPGYPDRASARDLDSRPGRELLEGEERIPFLHAPGIEDAFQVIVFVLEDAGQEAREGGGLAAPVAIQPGRVHVFVAGHQAAVSGD